MARRRETWPLIDLDHASRRTGKPVDPVWNCCGTRLRRRSPRKPPDRSVTRSRSARSCSYPNPASAQSALPAEPVILLRQLVVLKPMQLLTQRVSPRPQNPWVSRQPTNRMLAVLVRGFSRRMVRLCVGHGLFASRAESLCAERPHWLCRGVHSFVEDRA